MSILLNGGSNPSAVTYNGTSLTKVIYNGTTVWEAVTNATWKASTNSNIVVSGLNYRTAYNALSSTSSDYTIKIPSLTLTTNHTKFQPASGSPLWTLGYPFTGFSIPVTFTRSSGGTVSGTLYVDFTSGVMDISTMLNFSTYGNLITPAINTTSAGYLYTA